MENCVENPNKWLTFNPIEDMPEAINGFKAYLVLPCTFSFINVHFQYIYT